MQLMWIETSAKQLSRPDPNSLNLSLRWEENQNPKRWEVFRGFLSKVEWFMCVGAVILVYDALSLR